MKQPKCVSIIANIDIILSSLSLISVLIGMNPEIAQKTAGILTVSHEVSIFISVTFAISIIYFAINMIKGYDRARIGLLATHLFQIIVTFFIMKNKTFVLPSIPLFFVYYYFLNRADVLLYFRPDNYNEAETAKIIKSYTPIKKKRIKVSSARQLIAVLGFTFSSFFLIFAQFSMSFTNEENTIATTLTFMGIAGISLHISLSLWANDHWKILGIIFIITSVMTLMSCLTMLSLKDSPENFQMPVQTARLFEQYDPFWSIIISLLFLISGIAFIQYQGNRDRRSQIKKTGEADNN